MQHDPDRSIAVDLGHHPDRATFLIEMTVIEHAGYVFM